MVLGLFLFHCPFLDHLGMFSVSSWDFPGAFLKKHTNNISHSHLSLRADRAFGPQVLPCLKCERDRLVDLWGVVPPALTLTAHLSGMQFHVPRKESRTAAAELVASACPTAIAWTTYSRLRFGEAHAPIGTGALPVPKNVLVCKVSHGMGLLNGSCDLVLPYLQSCSQFPPKSK